MKLWGKWRQRLRRGPAAAGVTPRAAVMMVSVIARRRRRLRKGRWRVGGLYEITAAAAAIITVSCGVVAVAGRAAVDNVMTDNAIGR